MPGFFPEGNVIFYSPPAQIESPRGKPRRMRPLCIFTSAESWLKKAWIDFFNILMEEAGITDRQTCG